MHISIWYMNIFWSSIKMPKYDCLISYCRTHLFFSFEFEITLLFFNFYVAQTHSFTLAIQSHTFMLYSQIAFLIIEWIITYYNIKPHSYLANNQFLIYPHCSIIIVYSRFSKMIYPLLLIKTIFNKILSR